MDTKTAELENEITVSQENQNSDEEIKGNVEEQLQFDGEDIHEEESRKREHSRNYTSEEDKILVSRLMAAKSAGIDLNPVFVAIGDELGRPLGSVRNRWQRIKNQVENNNDMGTTVLVKLQALKSELDRTHKAEESWKHEAAEYKRELNQTRKELLSIKEDYEKLVAELHEVLGLVSI